MNDREKLVDLLAQACEWGNRCIGCKNNLPIAETCREERFGKAADHLIANSVTVQEWISVEDRLPEGEVPVLCWHEYYRCGEPEIKHRTYGIGCYLDEDCLAGEAATEYRHKVLYWQPMPEPPEEK